MTAPLEQMFPPENSTMQLAQMVKRYAQRERPRYATVIQSGPNGDLALCEILNEIDQTMLPRRVCIRSQPDTVMNLTISNRRLLAIDTRYNEPKSCLKTPRDAAQHFATLLRSAIREGQEVVIDPPSPTAPLDTTTAGLSVSAGLLRDALGLSEKVQGETGIAPSMQAFSAIQSISFASILATRDLHFSGSSGDAKQIEMLQAFWHDYVDNTDKDRKRRNITHQTRDCVFLPVNDEIGLVVATQEQELWCLALLPKARSYDLLDAWKRENPAIQR